MHGFIHTVRQYVGIYGFFPNLDCRLVHTRKYHYTTIYMCTSCKHPTMSANPPGGGQPKHQRTGARAASRVRKSTICLLKTCAKTANHESWEASCGSGIEAILQMDEPSFAAISLGRADSMRTGSVASSEASSGFLWCFRVACCTELHWVANTNGIRCSPPAIGWRCHPGYRCQALR